jgi:serine/threonine-protein phosphatase 5
MLKAYFRRATANMAIVKPKRALRDFRILAAKEPGNRDAVAKLAECEKIVRRIQFEKAIESESPPSAWEGLDLDDLGTPRLPPRD